MTPQQFAAGARVNVDILGPGTVVQTLPDGALVRLDSFRDVQIKQPYAALHLVEVEAVAPAAPSLLPQPVRESPGQFNGAAAAPASRTARQEPPVGLAQRKAIEALRFGQVPAAAMEDLTLGYGALHTWIRSRLPHAHDNKPQLSAVFGPYGTGKSHTMAVIRHVAEQAGYLTAHVEVDGSKISLAEPESLLFSLWQTVHGASLNSPAPLTDVYRKAAGRLSSVPQALRRGGLERSWHNFATIAEAEARGTLAWCIEAVEGLLSSAPTATATEVQRLLGFTSTMVDGTAVSLKRLIGIRISDRPYDFVAALAGHSTVAELAGFAGIVLTIDEFEVDASQLSRTGLDRAYSLLNTLNYYFRGEAVITTAPVAMFFATTGTQDHAGDDVIEQLTSDWPDARYVLHEYTLPELRALCHRIDDLYAQAYQCQVDHEADPLRSIAGEVASRLGSSPLIRAVVRSHLKHLDSAYGPPALAPL